ncbi:PRC-barrel domain-containing protein [Candidatus Saccharibacteria bacterium]|nr:PRC-barrel domain-containing protein [Candidatus Saccharibacteria bacterium]
MLIESSRLLNYPILSLHMAGMIAKTSELIIDPNDLKVIAFKLYGPEVGTMSGEYLRTDNVREFSGLGMVVDSADDFVNPDEVIKLKEVLDLNFSLNGMKVETRKGSNLGRVGSFTVNTDGFYVQQLVVNRPFFKSFMDPELLIGKSEIVKITDDKIIVKDEESKIRERATKEDFVPNFVNPFRKPQLSTADNQSLDEPSNE